MEETQVSGTGPVLNGDMKQRTWPLNRCLRCILMPLVTAHTKGNAIPSQRWFWQREAQGARGRLGQDRELQVLRA
jgi:hypothetical protein